ncbi:MAG: aminodeoxychorismate/anthranilate synthase component II [Pirellulales bacterium]
MILVIDNYDSFVYNLARYFQQLGQATRVVRNDAIDLAGVRALAPAAVVLSPGPCTPRESGRLLDVIGQLWAEIPMLGVCLGHQAIGMALGGAISRAPLPMHGRTSRVTHDGIGLFSGLSNPLTVGRYHSLMLDEVTLPNELAVTARADDGVVMAIAHRRVPVVGVQFHPESILTEAGYTILANFLTLAGIRGDGQIPSFQEELTVPDHRPTPLPRTPVTF